MSKLKLLLCLLLFPIITASTSHEYYVSVTNVEYSQDENALQIISQIFIDDFEKALRMRYDNNIVLAGDEEFTADRYMERYLKSKLRIWVNDIEVEFNYLGKEYIEDITYCYLEILNVKEIESLKMRNEILHEVYEEQQNIIRFKILGKNKSFLLIKDNAECMLNFN